MGGFWLTLLADFIDSWLIKKENIMNLTKICIYLTSIILASVPTLVNASPQIAPNPNYSTITVASV